MNHTSLILHWSRIPPENRNGIILGYKLSFIDATDESAAWVNHTILNDNASRVFSKKLSGLKIYTPYIFKLLGYTYRAEGPFSNNLTVWTDEFGEYFT